MNQVVSIYEAKTNLSKLVKKAQSGQTIYVGAYGKPQAMLVSVPSKKPIPIGIWALKRIPNAYKDEDIINPDQDIISDFNESLDRL